MKRKIKSLIYNACILMISIIIIYVFLTYVIGYRGYYTEGFQVKSQWNGPPFISGGVFQSICDYSIDNLYPLIPYDADIKKGDRVFMKVIDIPAFLESPPPVAVTVVISNSDETFDDELMMKLKPHVTAVYAINCSAPSAIQIPIGFRDDQYTPHRDLLDILVNPEIPEEKTTLCLVNFLLDTNGGERKRALDIFSSQSWVTVDKTYLNYGLSKSLTFTTPETVQKRLDYYKTLKQTKFVVCPSGMGVDTHRIYETLFFGGIPIIKTSFLDPMYERLGGCWIVKDWTEVTEEECNKRWISMKKGALITEAAEWLS